MTAEPNTRSGADDRRPAVPAVEPLVVDTGHGPVRGVDNGTVKVWKGIRYAAAPTGDLRWRAPQAPQQWSEPADATRVGPVCPQPTDPRIPIDLGAPQGDDCLTLNVWASSDTEAGDGKPVMVWLHGGAYILGSSAQSLYHGAALASGGDALIVTVNYRLGALGFLDLSSFGAGFDTNLGLRDALFALQWVRDNIAGFGGDPARVTLFGESAGAGMVTTLLASPAAAGLFSAAIAQSSPATSIYDSERGRRFAELFLDALDLARGDVQRLPSVPIDAVLAAAKKVFDEVPARWPGTLAFAPIIDGDIVPAHPVKLAREGRTHPVPLIIGTNKHEAALFRWMKSPLMPISPQALRAMFTEIAAEQPALQLPDEAQIRTAYRGRPKTIGMGVARDIGFRMPSIWFADGHREVAPVYLYRFDFAPPMLRLLRLGAAHATELPYVWGNLVGGPKDPTFKLGGLKAGQTVSARMRKRWMSFAVDGTPSASAGDPEWRPYRKEDRASLIIDASERVVDDLDRDLRLAWGDEVLSFR